MKKGFFDSAMGRAGAACVVTIVLTWIVVLRTANPTPDAPDPWYSWFVTPGLLGDMVAAALTAGIHSPLPAWVGVFAFYFANVLFWAPVAYLAIRMARQACVRLSRSGA